MEKAARVTYFITQEVSDRTLIVLEANQGLAGTQIQDQPLQEEAKSSHKEKTLKFYITLPTAQEEIHTLSLSAVVTTTDKDL